MSSFQKAHPAAGSRPGTLVIPPGSPPPRIVVVRYDADIVTEQTLSGSGGTVLSTLLPDEIAYLDFATGPCPGTSAEKWLPRTASHTMLGDENDDGLHFNPTIFGRIDALLANQMFTSPIGLENQRTVYWSVSQPIGNNVSLTPFRPGDVAHIVRTGVGDGQVVHFMRQEQFNQALGLPAVYGIDIDAIAFQPNYGVFFSVDVGKY